MGKELKVGDRVRVFGARFDKAFHHDGEIIGLLPEGALHIRFQHGTDTVHPKQCRRLVKKKRREWWVRFCDCSLPGVFVIKETAEGERCPCSVPKIVRVREVKERK